MENEKTLVRIFTVGCLILVGLLAALAVGGEETRADWGQEAHDETHQGFTNETLDAHELKWTATLRERYPSDFEGTPVVHNGRVIATDYYGLYVLDLETGEQLWNITFENDIFHEWPAAGDGVITINTWNDWTYGFNFEGKELWRTATGGHSITLHKGKVYTGGDNGLYCLNIQSGKVIWHIHKDLDVSQVAIFGKKAIFGVRGEKTFIRAVNKNTGESSWSYEMPDGWYTGGASIYKNEVYVSSFWIKGPSKGEITALDIDGNFRWNFSLNAFPTNPAIAYGKVFFGSYDVHDKQRDELIFYSLNSTNGEIIWTYPGASEGIPAISDHLVYATLNIKDPENQGNYFIRAFHEDNGTVYWKDDGDSWSSPSPYSSSAISNGTLVTGGIGSDVLAYGYVKNESPKTEDEEGFFEKLSNYFGMSNGILFAVGIGIVNGTICSFIVRKKIKKKNSGKC